MNAQTTALQQQTTILILDEDLPLVNALKLFLGRRGFGTRCANSFHSGLMNPPPHLLLLNMHLGNQDGRNICRTLKNHPEFGSIPIVIMSAAYQVRYSCIGAGATRFISKPFRMVELLEEVQFALV